MNSMPPFVAQERSDTCALACLRMVLAHQGKEVSEEELVEAAALPVGGVNPEELVRLMGRYGLRATEEQPALAEIAELIEREQFPIIFLYRRPLDGVPAVHAVLPVRTSTHFVTFLDPLRGRRRVSVHKFEEARRLVGKWAVVWEAS